MPTHPASLCLLIGMLRSLVQESWLEGVISVFNIQTFFILPLILRDYCSGYIVLSWYLFCQYGKDTLGLLPALLLCLLYALDCLSSVLCHYTSKCRWKLLFKNAILDICITPEFYFLGGLEDQILALIFIYSLFWSFNWTYICIELFPDDLLFLFRLLISPTVLDNFIRCIFQFTFLLNSAYSSL
jgi:hypothetical protein